MTRYDLFPTPLWHIEGASQQLIDELYQGAYYFKEKCPSANKSNKGGYQTPTFGWKDFHPEGKKYIEKIINDILKEFKVNGWWYNINPKGTSNIPHTHPGSDFALVWYVTDSDGLLNLMTPHPQRTIESNTQSNELFVSDGQFPQIIKLNAKKGDILIFPADMWHFVNPNERDTDRISISMNLQLC